jgi:hypothetical protein
MRVYQINVSLKDKYAALRPVDANQTLEDNKPIGVYWDDWGVTGNAVGDFVNCIYFTVCKEHIAIELSSVFKGLTTRRLEWHKNPKESKAKDVSRLKWLPKENIILSCIYPVKEVELLPSSTVKYEIGKRTGKRFISEVNGISVVRGDQIIPRTANMGFFISRKDAEDYDFFKPVGGNYLLCTNKVKEYIDDKNYSNIVFLEVGDIV